MPEMQFKVTAAGQRAQRVRIAADASVGVLKAQVQELFGVPMEAQVLLAGYPPQEVAGQSDEQALAEVFPGGREAITVTTREQMGAAPVKGGGAAATAATASTAPTRADLVATEREEARIVKVPSDNSCLFACVTQAFGLAQPSDANYEDVVMKLRRIVAATIRRNGELYSAATLGKPVEDYCRWIQERASWGGEIEMSILSNHLGAMITAIAVEDGQIYQYAPGLGLERAPVDLGVNLAQDPPGFCVLVYDGIHYDFVRHGGRGFFTGDFVEHPSVLAARDLVEQLRRKKAYVNPTSFTLTCNKCGAVCVGQDGAMAHAQETGHNDFGQQ